MCCSRLIWELNVMWISSHSSKNYNGRPKREIDGFDCLGIKEEGKARIF